MKEDEKKMDFLGKRSMSPTRQRKIHGMFGTLEEEAPFISLAAVQNDTTPGPEMELMTKWKLVLTLFGDVSKYDNKSILDLAKDDSEECEKKIEAGFIFFELFAQKAKQAYRTNEVTNAKKQEQNIKPPLTCGNIDEIMKIFIVLYEYLRKSFTSWINQSKGKSEEIIVSQLSILINKYQMMNEVLLLILFEDKKTTMNLPYDGTILAILCKINKGLPEILAATIGFKNKADIVHFYYLQFEALAIITAYNDSKRFMRSAASEAIGSICNVFEDYLKHSFISESSTQFYLSQIRMPENWMRHHSRTNKILSTFLGRKKIAMTFTGDSTTSLQKQDISFTLEYANLYYGFKTFKIMLERGNIPNEQKLMETIVSIFQYHSGLLAKIVENKLDFNSGNIGSLLNDCLICVKIITAIVAKYEEPIREIEKYSFISFFKQSICDFMAVSLSNKLIPLSKIKCGEKDSADFCSEMFKLLYTLQSLSTKKAESSPSKSKHNSQLSLYINEILLELLIYIESHFETFKPNRYLLRNNFTEYAEKSSKVMNNQLVNLVVRLYNHCLFTFTAPLKVDFTGNELKIIISEEPLDLESEKKLMDLFIKILAHDKDWALNIFTHLLGHIKNSINSAENLYGLFKVIYCSIYNEVYTNLDFLNILGKDNQNEVKCNEKVIGALAEANAEHIPVICLIESYKKKERNAKEIILEEMIMRLYKIPAICEVQFCFPHTFTTLLKECITFKQGRKFVLKYISLCLNSLQSKKIPSTNFDKSNYLPLIIINVFQEIISKEGVNPEITQLFLQYYDLLTKFLDCQAEPKVYQAHQKALFSNSAIETLFEITIKIQYFLGITIFFRDKETIYHLLQNFLKIIKGILHKNKQINIDLCNIISNKEITKILNIQIEKVKKVNFFIF